MKKQGILNAHLSYLIARMGHTDRLVICDCGLPLPQDAEVVDLALTKNIPTFMETLTVVLSELHIEGAIIAEEMETVSAPLYRQMVKALPEVPLRKISHLEFKAQCSGEGILFVRTGEATSYANIILISGVNFN